jgi:hypothetical protein
VLKDYEKQDEISSKYQKKTKSFLVKEKIYKILAIPLLVTLRYKTTPEKEEL